MKKIAVFCGARDGWEEEHKNTAIRCGELIADYGLTLIYGGSNTGLMAHVSGAVTDKGGKVIGVYPSILNVREPFSARISDPIFVDSMSVRKNLMILNAEAFIVLAGGMGTLDEVYEAITLKILGAHNKPIIFVNTKGYWDKFHEFAQHIVKHNFAAPNLFEFYEMVATPEEALKRLGFEA